MEVKGLDVYFLKITRAQMPPGKSLCTARICASFKSTAPRYDSTLNLRQSVTEASQVGFTQCLSSPGFGRDLPSGRVRATELSLSFYSVPVFHLVWSCP